MNTINIKIALKSASTTRGIKYADYFVKDDIKNLNDLIVNLVNIEIDKYEIEKEIEVLSQDDIDNMVISGKVSFGFKYRDIEIDRKNSENVALLAFKDGLFAVFINDEEIESLDDRLSLKKDDLVTFIRFTMLTGRYY